MESTGLTISDALALQNRDGMFGGGAGGWPLFLIFLLAWGNGGFGFGGGNNGALNQVNNDFLYNGMQRSISDLANNVSRGFDVIGNTLGQGFTQVTNQNFGMSKDLAQYNYNNALGQAGISREIESCCCSTNRNIDATRYEMSKGFCDIITANNLNTRDIIANQTANTQRIVDMMQANTIQDLRDKLNLAQMENIQSQGQLSQLAQTDAIVQRINPTPIPAWITCPPRSAYGCGGFYNGYGYCNS